MRYYEIKEAFEPNRQTQPLVKYFDRDCKDEKRINQQLTNLRRNLERFPEKQQAVIDDLKKRGQTLLARLVQNTVYPVILSGVEAQTKNAEGKIIRDLSGWSLPLYKKEMCVAGVGGKDIGGSSDTTGGKEIGGSGTNKGDSTQGSGGSDVGGDVSNQGDSTQGSGGSDVGGTIADKFGKEMGTLEGLITKGDNKGAIAFLDANPEFEAAIGGSFRSDIQRAIDAEAAETANRIAAEKAEKEAEEARIAKEKELERIAKEKAEEAAAAEAKAAEEKAAAEEAAKLEQEAIEAEKAEKARLEKEAEDARIAAEEAEKLRKQREEELERLEKERDEETADNDANDTTTDSEDEEDDKNVEEFDWEELQ